MYKLILACAEACLFIFSVFF